MDNSQGSGSSPPDLPHFVNADGLKIYIRRWNPQSAPRYCGPQYRAVLFMCHGVAEHIERHDPLASTLAEKGFLVVGHDHVGHGKSEGIRVDIQDFNFYVRDVLQHVHMVKDEFPDIRIFLFGHSMGGAVAILAALEESALFSGVLLSAPMIMFNPEQITPLRVFLVKIAACLFPQLHVLKLDTNDLSRDPDQVKAYEEDPLVYHNGLKARWTASALSAVDEIDRRMRDITWTYLLMHGSADKIVLAEGSEKLHSRSKSEDKTLKIYQGYFHELLNEPKEYSDIVKSDIESWLEAHLE